MRKRGVTSFTLVWIKINAALCSASASASRASRSCGLKYHPGCVLTIAYGVTSFTLVWIKIARC